MIGRLLLAAVAGLGLLAGSAVMPKAPAAPSKPKLIVVVSVDQFSADLFNQYRGTYSAGLKRLLGGVVFPAGYQSHAATETCPGHSTILTGGHPARTGIIANNWMDPAHPRTGKDGKPDYTVYCAEDPSTPGSNSANYTVSPRLLKMPTLGDRLKAVDPQSKVVSISGKDRAAVMLGGHNPNLAIWWDGKAFTSFKGRDVSAIASVKAANEHAQKAIAKPVHPVAPAHCLMDTRLVSLPNGGSVGTFKPSTPGDPKLFRTAPEFDRYTMDMALAALDELKLGAGATTDLLAIGLSGTDYVGHTYGTEGVEMCTQIATVDILLGKLFAKLDRLGRPYAIVVTADHGGHDVVERNVENGLPAAQRVEMALFPKAMSKVLAGEFGLTEEALIGDAPFGDLYLSRSIPAEKRDAVLIAAIAHYRESSQVEAVFTKDQIAKAPAPRASLEDWSLLDRVRANFDPERSGDFYVVLKSFVTPIPREVSGYVATHGSPWGYDRRVPILYWWKGITHYEQPNGIETVDILPTLASLIGLSVPQAEIDGRCIDVMAGAPSNCR
jgi:alkaline phosphatase